MFECDCVSLHYLLCMRACAGISCRWRVVDMHIPCVLTILLSYLLSYILCRRPVHADLPGCGLGPGRRRAPRLTPPSFGAGQVPGLAGRDAGHRGRGGVSSRAFSSGCLPPICTWLSSSLIEGPGLAGWGWGVRIRLQSSVMVFYTFACGRLSMHGAEHACYLLLTYYYGNE